MSYEVGYIDGLQGTWIAQPIPVSTAPIQPYSTGLDGGFAFQAPRSYQPPVGSPTAVLDRALEAETYVTPTGARAWKATAADDALIDAVTSNPYLGLDELNAARAAGYTGRGASGASRYLPYVGDVVGGAVEAAAVYGETGSLTHATFAGGGATLGSIAGTAIGASIGAVGGPVGVAIGGVVGGAIGSAFGSAAGQALANLISPLPPANLTGAQQFQTDPPFTGGQGVGVQYSVLWTQSYGNPNQRFDYLTGPLTLSREGTGSVDCGPGGGTYNVYTMKSSGLNINLASGCEQTATNIRVVRRDGLPDTDGDPTPLTEPFNPIIPLPKIPRIPGFRLPVPIPRLKPAPTSRPTENPDTGPTGTPFGLPKPITGLPTLPTVTAPGDYPSDGPHDDPYPDGDKPNPNPVEQPGPENEPCDPCAELRDIKAKLEETFSLAWALPECDVDFSITREGAIEGQGLAGLSQKIDGLYQILRVLHDNTRCSSEGRPIPETWNLKRTIDIDQLIIVTKKLDDKSSYRRSFTIPHPRYKTMKTAGVIKRFTYKRGSAQATINLRDNSSCVLNCSTIAEAKRVVKYVLQLIEPEWARDAHVNIVEKINMEIQPATVHFHRAEYFSTTDDRVLPDWSIRLK